MTRTPPLRRTQALVLAAVVLVAGCGRQTQAVVPDRDADGPMLDTEPPWAGRRAELGLDFTLAPGEAVGFGDHGPVVEWLSRSATTRGIVVKVTLSRIPPDVLLGVALEPGESVVVGPCALSWPQGSPQAESARLRMTCDAPRR